VLWHPIYHEEPRTPLKLHFKDGRLVEIGGDKYLSNRVRNWLHELNDEGTWEGPNHLNIGINPNALLTQNQEWERVYGSVTCGMGNMTIVAGLFERDAKVEWSESKVHWDTPRRRAFSCTAPHFLLDFHRRNLTLPDPPPQTRPVRIDRSPAAGWPPPTARYAPLIH
jgi:hypothetical protein